MTDNNSVEPQTKKAKVQQACFRAVGFCGVDNSNTPQELIDMSVKYEGKPEWGVLFRPEMEGSPRFPTFEWVKSLSETIAKWEEEHPERKGLVKLAGHLCSTRCQEILKGDVAFVKQLSELGFKRVQVNATKANDVDSSNLDEVKDNVEKAIRAVPEMEFIVQRNAETKPLWADFFGENAKEAPSNMSILFDDSVGRGVLCTTFTEPENGIPVGYAGGIGPDNVVQVVEGVAKAAGDRPVWIDMESSLRTIKEDKTDIFDLVKVSKCMDNIIASKLMAADAAPAEEAPEADKESDKAPASE